MSPSGDNLRNWCRSFPGLVNNTYIDWLFPWPSQALLAVAHVFLTDVSTVLNKKIVLIICLLLDLHMKSYFGAFITCFKPCTEPESASRT